MAYGGADYNALIGLRFDRYKVIADIIDFIDDQGIESFADLLRFSKEHKPQWFRALCDNSAYVINKYLKSVTWERINGER